MCSSPDDRERVAIWPRIPKPTHPSAINPPTSEFNPIAQVMIKALTPMVVATNTHMA